MSLNRLSTLIKRSRADMYKPIAIAEILYRARLGLDQVSLSDQGSYRRRSERWMKDIIGRLHNKTTQLNSRYWDQLFDPAIFPPDALETLAQENGTSGLVENAIYLVLKEKFSLVGNSIEELESMPASDFELDAFLHRFTQDPGLRRSLDRVFEVVAFSLFVTLTDYLGAEVRLTLAPRHESDRAAFGDFCEKVLLLTADDESRAFSARFFRVGTANQADAGIDMWANFGPAIQVKHLSMGEGEIADAEGKTGAEHLVLVCRSTTEAKIARSALSIGGPSSRTRAVVTEDDLIDWYRRACSPAFANSLGSNLLHILALEMRREFAISNPQSWTDFFGERGYKEGADQPLQSVIGALA